MEKIKSLGDDLRLGGGGEEGHFYNEEEEEEDVDNKFTSTFCMETCPVSGHVSHRARTGYQTPEESNQRESDRIPSGDDRASYELQADTVRNRSPLFHNTTDTKGRAWRYPFGTLMFSYCYIQF